MIRPTPTPLKHIQGSFELPPEGSALAKSLERGLLARRFTSFSRLGRGGFGEVVKAWDVEAQQWCAVKFIPVNMRADDVIDDNDKVWSGGRIFDRLCKIRCRHVLRYHRRWVELAQDVAVTLPQGVSSLAATDSTLTTAAPVTTGPSISAEDEDLSPCAKGWRCACGTTMSPVPAEGWGADCEMTLSSLPAEGIWEEESDGGFDWSPCAAWAVAEFGVSPRRKNAAPEPRQVSPQKRYYKAVLMVQMEYYEGVTLHQWLLKPESRQGLSGGSFESALNLATQLIEGLVEIHREGIVHRDIKPENIIISNVDGLIKIIDFGLSCMASDEAPSQSSEGKVSRARSASARSDLCLRIGTPGYTPPEHGGHGITALSTWARAYSAPDEPKCHGASPGSSEHSQGCIDGHSPHSDVFSAGVVVVELLMAAVRGGPAWGTGMERAGALRALCEGRGGCELPLELRRTPQVEGWLRRLVSAMLSYDISGRPSSLQVLNDLTSGLWSQGRRNPYTGTGHVSSVQLKMPAASSATCRNPYVGYFLDREMPHMGPARRDAKDEGETSPSKRAGRRRRRTEPPGAFAA